MTSDLKHKASRGAAVTAGGLWIKTALQLISTMLLARLLALSPRVLVLDEPTRGIDVGAKVEIQRLVADLADNGLSVLFISAELEEVLRVSNRIAIMRGGRLVDTIPADSLTVDSLLALVARPEDES